MNISRIREGVAYWVIMAVSLLLCTLPQTAFGIAYQAVASGDWSAAGTWNQGSGFPGFGSSDTALVNNNYTIDVNVDVTLDSLTIANNSLPVLHSTLGRTITTGNFLSTNNGNFTLDTGLSLDLTGTGLYQIRGGTVNGTLNVLNNAVLTYTVTVDQSGSGNINVATGGKIDIQSNKNITSGISLDNNGLIEFNNSGTFGINVTNVTGGGEWRLNSGSVTFNNSAQTISLNANSTNFTGAAGSILFDNVANTTHTLGSFNMTGTSSVTFGDSSSTTFQINGASTFQDLSVTSGDMVDFAPAGGGPRTHAINGTLSITSSGSLIASDSAGAILNVHDFSGFSSGASIGSGVTLNLAGTGTWSGNGTMTMDGGINLQNGSSLTIISRETFGSGTFNIATGAELILDGSFNANRKIDPNVVNNGLVKSVNSNIRPINGAVSGTGTFLVESGILDMDGNNTDIEGWGDGSTGIFNSQATWHVQGTGQILLRGNNNTINTIGSNATVILEDGGRLAELNFSARNSLAVEGELHVRGTSDLLFNSGQGIALTGVLGGDGTISGNVTSTGGTLAPGNSPGTLTIGGNLLLDDTSLLDFELGGGNDLIVVDGALTLDGILNVTDLGSFGAGIYDLIQYDTLTADNGLDFGVMPSSGFSYSLLTGSGLVQLQVTAFSSAIPEPASGFLLGLGACCLLGYRRKQRKQPISRV